MTFDSEPTIEHSISGVFDEFYCTTLCLAKANKVVDPEEHWITGAVRTVEGAVVTSIV